MSVQRDGWIDEWTDGHTNCQAGTERGRAQASGASLSPKDPGQNPRASFRWLENHGCPPTLCDRELGVSERARERLNIAQIVSRRIRAQTQVSCLPPTPPPAGGNTKHVPPNHCATPSFIIRRRGHPASPEQRWGSCPRHPGYPDS